MQTLTSTRLHFPISFASLATSHFHEKSSSFSPIRISPSSPSTPGIHPWRVNVCSTFPFRLPRWKQTAPGLGHLLSLSYFLCLLTSLFPASFLSFSFSFLSCSFVSILLFDSRPNSVFLVVSTLPSYPSIHRTIHTGQIVGKHLSNGNKSVMDFISYIRIVCIICFVLLLYVYILYLCMYVCIDMYWRWIVTNYNTPILFIICKLLYISNYKYYRL